MVVLFENILLALEGLRSNKMRALLTMLGIIIGVSSVIGIVTVGQSMSSSVTSEMQGLGATNIGVQIMPRPDEDGTTSYNLYLEESDFITDEMIEQFRSLYPDQIEAVSLEAGGANGKAQDGRLYANVSEVGVNAGYKIANNTEVVSGRFIRDEDVLSKRSVAVVSDKFVANMFPNGGEPLGTEIKVTVEDDIHTFTIVGVYKYEQQGLGMGMMGFTPTSEKNIRTNMFIPISTQKMLDGSSYQGHYYFTLMVAAGTDPIVFAGTVTDFFNTYYYANNPDMMIDAMAMETMMSTVTNVLGTLSIAVSVIAGISLLVGGIGVMNIMLVSVTERTKEIGTRKALGARNSAIRVQFIVEAVIICSIGGLLGIGLGIALGMFGSSLLGFATAPSLTIIIIAVLFSMMIGVFFGYYPANKAAKLDPIEALRYE